MKRILATIVTAATIGGAMAPAAFAQAQAPVQSDPQVEMLTGKVYRALRDCDIDANDIDSLTMSQVAGIALAASSVDPGDRCQQIEAIAIS